MKRQYIQLLSILLAIATLVSCVKDRGNYETIDLPGISLKSIAIQVNGTVVPDDETRTIIMNTNDQLQITIDEDIATGFDPTYQWMIYDINPILQPGVIPEPAMQIANSKNLDIRLIRGPGKYKIFRKAINKNNDDSYINEFIVEIESLNGLLVFELNNNNQGDYSIVRTAEMNLGLPPSKLDIHYKLYSSINPSHNLQSPTQLWLRQTGDAAYDNQIFAVSTQGIAQINYRTHQWQQDNTDALFTFPLEGNFVPEGHMNGSNRNEYLINNGQVYSIDYMGGPSSARYAQLSDDGLDYSPYMMTIPTDMQTFRMYSNVVYNRTLQRFEYDEFGTLMPFYSGTGNLGTDDVDISQTGMDLIAVAKGKGTYIDAVMKTPSNNYSYIRFDITDPYDVKCTDHIDLTAINTAIDSRCHWAIAQRGPFAYFSLDDKVQLLNYNNNSITTVVGDLPSGANITCLHILQDKNNAQYDNAVLYVAYNQGQQGTLLQYEINPLSGTIKTGSKKTFTGFGRILDLKLKK